MTLSRLLPIFLVQAQQASTLSAFTDDAVRLRQHQEETINIGSTGQMMVRREVHAHSRDTDDVEEGKRLKEEYPFYHTGKKIHQEVHRLSKGCGGMLNVTTVHDPDVSIDVITVRKPTAKPANKVFLLFGEHSRELISPESGLYFLKALCSDIDLEIPGLPGTSLLQGISADDALEDSEFQMVLNANPRSRKKVEDGNYCLRVDPNGVDLNRNWDEEWQGQAATFGGDSNPGPSPFSEPETRIFKRLVTDYRPTTFLTIHSGTRGMYMPWAFDMQHMATMNAKPMMEVLTALDAAHCQCPYGAAGKEVGYPCPGTCLDYAYSKLQTPFAFAFEIYTRPEADEQLKKRWQRKMNSAPASASFFEKGHNLGHPHFRDLFAEHKSDFISDKSTATNRRTQELSVASLEGAMDLALQDPDDDGCFDMFNPGSKEDYNKVVKNWAQTYFQMSSLIAHKIRSGEVDKGEIVDPSPKADSDGEPI